MICDECGYTGRSAGTWHTSNGKLSECPKCGVKSPFIAPPGAAKRARLISAAPELLEALQAAVECGMVPKSSVADGGSNKYSQQVRVADQIRAAIAKATGDAS